MASADTVFVDAGVFIGALLGDDPRHQEARPLVESARCGEISWCTSAGVLAEVYAALTWIGAQPPQSPDTAAEAVRLLVAEHPPFEFWIRIVRPDCGCSILPNGTR